VRPLDQTLGFGVGWLAYQHLRTQRAAKRLALTGQFDPPGAPASDRALTVPDQHPRHRPAPTGAATTRRTDPLRRGSGSVAPTTTASNHRPSSAPATASAAASARTHRQADRREPQIALSDLPRDITRPRRRIGRHIRRPQLSHPARQRADRTGPPDPLRDHRRRHRRERPQQLTNPRLNRVHSRPCRRPLILRCDITGQRRTHRVPRHPEHPRDLRDRHPLRPTQPTDLRPILHVQHPLPPRSTSSQALGEGDQNSVAAPCSVFSCRRQTRAFRRRSDERILRAAGCDTLRDTDERARARVRWGCRVCNY